MASEKYVYVVEEGKRPRRDVLSAAFAPTSTTFSVGSGGDFPTLGAALAHLDSFVSTNFQQVIINILSGYVLKRIWF